MAVACAGDIELTEEGKALAKASVQGKKDVFWRALLARIAIAAEITRTLREQPSHRMRAEVFRDTVERHCSAKEARRQLVTLIAWGRSAEAFAYDEATRDVYLEPEDNPLR